MANLYLLFDENEVSDNSVYHIECDAADDYSNRYKVVFDALSTISVMSYKTHRQINVPVHKIAGILEDKYIYLTDEEYLFLTDADLSTLTDPANPDSPRWEDMI